MESGGGGIIETAVLLLPLHFLLFVGDDATLSQQAGHLNHRRLGRDVMHHQRVQGGLRYQVDLFVTVCCRTKRDPYCLGVPTSLEST
jgi:hypothetical protein